MLINQFFSPKVSRIFLRLSQQTLPALFRTKHGSNVSINKFVAEFPSRFFFGLILASRFVLGSFWSKQHAAAWFLDQTVRKDNFGCLYRNYQNSSSAPPLRRFCCFKIGKKAGQTDAKTTQRIWHRRTLTKHRAWTQLCRQRRGCCEPSPSDETICLYMNQ